MFCCFFTESKSQNYTIDDFKLCLDTFGCEKKITITKKQLLDIKKIKPNFNFFHIKHTRIYFGAGVLQQSVILMGVFGDSITIFTEKFINKIHSNTNTPITIVAEGVNNSGKELTWGKLEIYIKE